MSTVDIPVSNPLQRLHTLPTSHDPFLTRVDHTLKNYQGESTIFHYVAFTKILLVCNCPLGFASRTNTILLPKVGDQQNQIDLTSAPTLSKSSTMP
jgi:hypothetical protein